MRQNSAILMLTHSPQPRVLQHFERIERESGLKCYLVCHNSAPLSQRDNAILIKDGAIARAQPRRSAERLQKKRAISNGYVDLVAFTAAMDRRLAIFDYLWILEEDIDFSGHWGSFFNRFRFSRADLVGFYLREPSADPNWYHWAALKTPANAPKLGIYIPSMRISKRFLAAYLRETESGRWSGHPEAMAAGIAVTENMRIEDMLLPSRALGWSMKPLADMETYRHRPVQGSSYFHENPDAFGRRNQLYHPVKIET